MSRAGAVAVWFLAVAAIIGDSIPAAILAAAILIAEAIERDAP